MHATTTVAKKVSQTIAPSTDEEGQQRDLIDGGVEVVEIGME